MLALVLSTVVLLSYLYLETDLATEDPNKNEREPATELDPEKKYPTSMKRFTSWYVCSV